MVARGFELFYLLRGQDAQGGAPEEFSIRERVSYPCRLREEFGGFRDT